MATPEITMANGVSSRHIACKLCRDRKVRCGGEQPVCEKCRRAGEQCIYLPAQKPTKADLTQMVEALQKRLDEAEAYITQSKASSNNAFTFPSASYHSDWPSDPDAQTLLSSADHTPPSAAPSGSASASHNGSSCSSLLYRQHNLQPNGSGFQDSSQAPIPQQQPRRLNDDDAALAPFSVVDGPMNLDASDLDFCAQDGFGFPPRGPFLSEETGAAILEPVTTFSSALLRSQAEAAVIASTAANYIAWLRTAPPGGGVAMSEQPVLLGMLGTLEARLRELCDVVGRARSGRALHELVVALGALAPPGGAVAARLGSLEEDLQKEARERGEAFRARYNPCALLSEQPCETSQ